MAADPDARYAAVSEFDAELARWRAKRPVAAIGHHWRYRARQWLDRRQPSVVLMAFVAGAGTLAAILSILWSAGERDSQKPRSLIAVSMLPETFCAAGSSLS